jgi:P27 family predicted phage terminase small subunit
MANDGVPKYLEGDARWLWDELAPEAIRLGLLTSLSVHAFAAMCEAFARWREYEYLSTKVGPQMAVQTGYRRIAREEREAMVRIGSKFGIDPAALGSVTATPPPAGDKAAEDIRAKFFGVPGGKQRDLFGSAKANG